MQPCLPASKGGLGIEAVYVTLCCCGCCCWLPLRCCERWGGAAGVGRDEGLLGMLLLAAVQRAWF
jgi:hypothetical protein